ncbi:MAG TPA: hypothetical protein VGZ00_04625 [Candidatus Baltobacteraceae bacterium]|jgi:hypothetical protein|nr:hypothetical protein [Candidatus Baltobacteraceae bacterium]
MLKSFHGSVLVVLVSLMMPLLSACSGGGGGGGALVPQPCNLLPPITTNYPNPVGITTAGTGTAWQVTNVSTALTEDPTYCNLGTRTYEDLTVNVTFAQNVSGALPPPGTTLSLPTQLGVAIGIDSDSNPKTGNYAGCNSRGINDDENLSDVGSYGLGIGAAPGGGDTFSVLGPLGIVGSEETAFASGNTFTARFFLVGNSETNMANPTFRIDLGVVNGSPNGTSATECVPANAEFGVNPQGIFSY